MLIGILGIFINASTIETKPYTLGEIKSGAIARIERNCDGYKVIINKDAGLNLDRIDQIMKSAKMLMLSEPDSHCFTGENEVPNLPEECTTYYPYINPNPCWNCNYELQTGSPYCHASHLDEDWSVECGVYSQAGMLIFTDYSCEDIIIQHTTDPCQ